jgi:outer membrane protein OmpA-like peptidoglycan-associated protein
MSGFSSGVDKVDPEIIKECGQELRITIGNPTAEKESAPVAPRAARPAVKRTQAPPPPAPSSGSDAWRRAGILAASLAAFSLAWYFGGDRILDALSRWRAGSERAATATSKAPALSGLTQAAPTEDRGDPAAQGTPAPRPSPENPLPNKRETPGEKPGGAQGGSTPAPAATAVSPQAAARPADKTEAAAAVPAAPTPSSPPRISDTAGPPSAAGSGQPGEPFELKEFTVRFTKNSIETSADAQYLLATAASLLKRFPDTRADIEGHTDAFGDAAFNRIVSENRAVSVRDYFLDQGIGANRLRVFAFGSEKPLESNATAEGRNKNRRVVIRIVTTRPG